jgi:hypothetical protein
VSLRARLLVSIPATPTTTGIDSRLLAIVQLQGRDRVVTAGPRLLPLAARPGQAGGRAARVE